MEQHLLFFQIILFCIFSFTSSSSFRVWQLAKDQIGMRPALLVRSSLACTCVCYIILLFACCFLFLFVCFYLGGKKKMSPRRSVLSVFLVFTHGVRCCLYRPKYSIQLTLKMQNKKIQACPRLWSIVAKGMRSDQLYKNMAGLIIIWHPTYYYPNCCLHCVSDR